jgi:hypothetical protein
MSADGQDLGNWPEPKFRDRVFRREKRELAELLEKESREIMKQDSILTRQLDTFGAPIRFVCKRP